LFFGEKQKLRKQEGEETKTDLSALTVEKCEKKLKKIVGR
jgi:hypothetical protein